MSTRVTSGTLKASQNRTKRAPFCDGGDVQGAGQGLGLVGHEPDRAPADAGRGR